MLKEHFGVEYDNKCHFSILLFRTLAVCLIWKLAS